MTALAIADGASASESVDAASQRVIRQTKGDEFFYGGAWPLYLKLGCGHSALADVLGMTRTQVIRVMDAVGLPSLFRWNASSASNAILRFRAGESLKNACKSEGVAVDEVEKLLRISISRVCSALKHLRADRDAGRKKSGT